jgi:hypothetical protein
VRKQMKMRQNIGILLRKICRPRNVPRRKQQPVFGKPNNPRIFIGVYCRACCDFFRTNHDANLRTGLAYLAQHEPVGQVMSQIPIRFLYRGSDNTL